METTRTPGLPFPRVTAVEVVAPYQLHLTFQDGTSGTIDGSRWLTREPVGVFRGLRDPAEFAKVRLEPAAGTIAWPGDIDLCPDVLYALAHGIALPGIE